MSIRSFLQRTGSVAIKIWWAFINLLRPQTATHEMKPAAERPKLVVRVVGPPRRKPWEDMTPEEQQHIRDHLKLEARVMMGRNSLNRRII